jgi:hypothetical protein
LETYFYKNKPMNIMKITHSKLLATALFFVFFTSLSAQNVPHPMLPKNWKSMVYTFSSLKMRNMKKIEKPKQIESNVIRITVYDCKEKVVQ